MKPQILNGFLRIQEVLICLRFGAWNGGQTLPTY